MNNMMMMSL